MTIDFFNSLPEARKKEIIVDAKKVAEHADDIAKEELFQVDNFFVAVKTSLFLRYRKIANTYSLKDIPLMYAGKVMDTMNK